MLKSWNMKYLNQCLKQVNLLFKNAGSIFMHKTVDILLHSENIIKIKIKLSVV